MSFFKSLFKGHIKDPELVFFDASIELAKDIEDLMEKNQINNTQLAENLECSKAYVTKILKGDANLTMKTLSKISVALEGKLHIRLHDNNEIKSLNRLNDFVLQAIEKHYITSQKQFTEYRISYGNQYIDMQDALKVIPSTKMVQKPFSSSCDIIDFNSRRDTRNACRTA